MLIVLLMPMSLALQEFGGGEIEVGVSSVPISPPSKGERRAERTLSGKRRIGTLLSLTTSGQGVTVHYPEELLIAFLRAIRPLRAGQDRDEQRSTRNARIDTATPSAS